VVKDVDDEYSDREWEGVEVVRRVLIVVVVAVTRWEEDQTKPKQVKKIN
jgi:hypothetical protein